MSMPEKRLTGRRLKMIAGKIKSVIACIVAVVIIALIALLCIMGSKLKSTMAELDVSRKNNMAYQNEMIQHEFTMRQMGMMTDSISMLLRKTKDSLKIKDRNMVQFQYIEKRIEKTDTVFFNDTIFRSVVDCDTVIGDEWYEVVIGMEYPSTIVVSPKFKSQTVLTSHVKKVPVDAPRKTWIGRLFQKKQKVVETDVVEKNPYIENVSYRNIQILK